MINKDVQVIVTVDYQGTIINKAITVKYKEGASNASMVNQGLDLLTKKIQMMVQSEQGITS